MSDNCECVRVAVNIRPLVTNELVMGCTDCVTVYPSENQVQIGSHAFTFDYVFGSKCSPSTYIFEACVAPLVDALFHGYNGTVLAYGQTGSGKTYTMGTNYNGDEHKGGVIPNVMEAIFSKVESMKNSTDFLIRVSFIEIFKEEVFDLLGKTGGPGRIPIQIRERINGEIALAGVTEAEVRTKEEMSSYLLQGSLSRATGSTNMNHQSSRSHAIFTISMEQKKINSSAGDGIGDDVLIAKLHLVDLAGSERAKRTGADGKRLQEGIHINKGLLALGNVISSLGDEKKRKEGGHVPYRDSKLTRILQDSLGGNSKTVMIACISPADTNAEETLNTLKYANRARNIQNKAVVNRDPMGAQLQRMRSQIEELQAELLYYSGNSTAPAEDIKIMKQKISLLEASNTELKSELHKSRLHFEHMSQRVIDAQVERDRLLMKIQSVQNGNPMNEADAETDQNLDLLKGYITKIQELEGEIMRIQNSSGLRREISVGYLDFEDDGCHSRDSFLIDSVTKDVETDGVVEDVEKELEHSSLQQKLDCELKELDKRLEQKEAEMKQFANTDTSVLKQHYEKKLHELELEKRDLLKEINTLRQNYANICSNSDDSAQKLKEEYLQKLNALECQVAELKKKQDAQAQLLRQKQKSDEAGKRLLDEIQRIKTQKVQLQQKIKQESEQFRLWKASREKEVLQLKKEGRRNEYEMHKLLALNQRQKLVLQRKTEEATMATKRLKELLDSRKASRETLGSNKGPGTQALVKTIENELELIVSKHQVQSEYDRQLKERAKWAEELARLKGKTLSEFPESMSPGARNSRIFALENMLSTSSSHIVSMGSHLSEADERESAFNGRGRWNHVHSLAEAKNIMNFLFNLASSSRCQLSDMEFECREKDSEIRDLKEKVVHLVRQIEIQRAEFNREKTLVMLTLERQSKEVKGHSKIPVRKSSDGHVYDIKPKDSHSSAALNGGVFRSVEDMDTSDDDYHTDDSYAPNEEDSDSDWVLTRDRKKRQVRRKTFKPINQTVINLDPEDSPEKEVCCSCSKSSSCKTPRCECRASGRNCTEPCGCVLSKCSNRIEACKKDDARNESFVDSCSDLANHGAALLQAALSEKPNTTTEAASTRKPLSDIGNNMATTGAGKGGPRKKWRTPVIQLVPSSSSSLPPNPQVQNAEAPPQHAKSKEEDDIPLKLPRAMRSALSTNNNQMSESDQYDESANKESNASPRQAKPKSGKENMGL